MFKVCDSLFAHGVPYVYRCQQHLWALDVTCNAKANLKIYRGFYMSAPCFIEFIKRVREKR